MTHQSFRPVVFSVFFLFLTPTSLLAQHKAPDLKFKTYHNVQYGFSLNYPSALLQQIKGTNIADGIQLRSKNHKVKADIWGSHQGGTISQSYVSSIKSLPNTENIYFSQLKDNVYIVIGSNNKDLFFRMTTYQKEGSVNFQMRYPIDEAKLWMPVLQLMAQSLQPLPGSIKQV